MVSFSLDFFGVLTNANAIVNGLFPVYFIPLSITFGIGILGYIVKSFLIIIHPQKQHA